MTSLKVLMEKLNRESIEVPLSVAPLSVESMASHFEQESAISYRSWRAKTFEEVFVRTMYAVQSLLGVWKLK